jgi:branched-chain amino acid transport system substrate-binding protein
MRIRTAARVVVPLVASALALAGCGDDGGTAGDGEKKTYTIAYQGPLSGDNKQLGINMDNGVQLAIEQAKADGDLDFDLKYANADDGGDPAKAPTAAQKLIDDASVIAVVGPAFSGATAAAEPLFSQANLVSVTPSATRADLTSLGFTTFLRVITGDNIQGVKVADYLAKGLKTKKVYVIDDKSAYGAGLTKFVKDQLKTNGVTVVEEGIAPTKDYSAVATKVAGSGADAVYYGGYYAELALLTKALKAAQFKGIIASDDGAKDDQYVKQGGAATEGTYISCPCGPTAENDAAKKFAADYKAKFGVDPGTYSAEAFDATNAIIAAMKGIDGDITREAVVEAVKKVEHEGVTHTIKFDDKGEGGTGDIFIYQVKSGKIELLGKTDELVK